MAMVTGMDTVMGMETIIQMRSKKNLGWLELSDGNENY